MVGTVVVWDVCVDEGIFAAVFRILECQCDTFELLLKEERRMLGPIGEGERGGG